MASPISLTCAQKPNAGQVWQLQPTKDGFELRDAGGELVTTIPAAETGYRFRFPSFWASVRYLEILMPEGGAHYFEPNKATVAAVKEQVDEALGLDPAGAAAALRRKALPALGIGVLALVAGLGTTAYSYMNAAAREGGGNYYVLTGLIGVGVFSLCRGLMWYARAARLSRTARGA
jgi:hypothetical protein